jgi:hypothetical protein
VVFPVAVGKRLERRRMMEETMGHFMTFYGELSQPLLDLLRAHGVGFRWFRFVQGLESSPVNPAQISVAAGWAGGAP